MSGFWSICCFSLKTKYQQHNPQSLCNKSFCPSIVSFGSVVLIPEGAQEVICQPLPESSPLLQQGPRLRDCSWCFGQRRAAPRSWRCARGRARGTVRPQRGSSAGPTPPTRLQHGDSGRRRRGAWSVGEREN